MLSFFSQGEPTILLPTVLSLELALFCQQVLFLHFCELTSDLVNLGDANLPQTPETEQTGLVSQVLSIGRKCCNW